MHYSRFIVCAILTISSLSAANRYLDVNAVGAKDGSSPADAWTSPATAGATISPGDTLWINSGVYDPSTSFAISAKANITVRMYLGATEPAIIGGQTWVSGPQPVGSQIWASNNLLIDGSQYNLDGTPVLVPGDYVRGVRRIPLLRFVGAAGTATTAAPGGTPIFLVRNSVGVTIRGVEFTREEHWLNDTVGYSGLSFNGPCDYILIEDVYSHHLTSDLININVGLPTVPTTFDRVVIRHCTLVQSGDDAVQSGTPGLTVEDCVMDNTLSPRHDDFGHSDGIQTPRYKGTCLLQRNWIKDFGQNIFVENPGYDIFIWNNIIYCTTGSVVGTRGIVLDVGSTFTGSCIVANNTVVGVISGVGWQGPGNLHGGTLVFDNNVFVNVRVLSNSENGVLTGPSNIYYNYPGTVFYQSNGAPGSPSNNYPGGSTRTDPGLVDPLYGDFRIAELTSTAVARGVNLSAYFTDDSEGNARASSGSWDSGAYTFGEVGSDTSAPTVTATIPAGGATIVFTFNEIVAAGVAGTGGMTLSATGGAVTATYLSGSGTSSWVYSLSRPIFPSGTETVTRTYSTVNGIEDAAGNDLAPFSGAAVINNSTYGSGGVDAPSNARRISVPPRRSRF